MSDDLRKMKDDATKLTTAKKLPAALEAWKKVVAAAPTDAASHQKVAELLVRLERKADAVHTYEVVARLFAEQSQFFKASAVCRVIVGLEPGHQRTQELIATLYARSQASATAARAKLPPAPPKPVAAPVVAPPPAPVELDVDLEIELEEPKTESGLPSIPLFSTLTHAELKEVLSSAMEVRALAAGEVVVVEGAPGDTMYALAEGEAEVFRGWGSPEQRKVAHVAAGDIFGEAALVSGAPRLATVVVSSPDAVALEIRRDAMAQVVARHPAVGQMLEQFYRQRLLANALRASPILRALPEGDKKAISASFRYSTFKPGQPILAQGQAVDSVHLLLRGVCTASHGSGARYPDLREGDLFGEVSVLTDGLATATVAAASPVLTLRLAASDFKARVLSHPESAAAVKRLADLRLQRTAQFDQATLPRDAQELADDRRV